MIPKPGQSLSRYRLVDKIGEGGMGVVWKAEDTILGRSVAIKILSADSARDEKAREMFLDEARLASSIGDAHIVQVHDFGQEQGLDFIVMEFVEGKPLSRIIQGRPLPPEKVAAFGSQIARALSRAHRKGLLHRDLKPSNILITPDGDVKVVDFGLATLFTRQDTTMISSDPTRSIPRRREEEERQPRQVVGTLPYMSPEQVGGEELDTRTDIFSLGVVLYEMTTGHRPFLGTTTVELVREIRKANPEPVHNLVPKVPLDLDRIIQKSLAVRRGERYQTMEDLAVDLKRLARELESGSSPSWDDIREALEPEHRRRRWMMILAGGGLIALVAVVAVLIGVFMGGRSGSPPEDGGNPVVQTLAVLPLRNISGDPGQAFLVDGITEELTTQVAKIGSIRVISTTSAMRYRETEKTLAEIAHELKVGKILEGSALRAGDRVRVTIQLTDAATERLAWAESYEREFRDILVLQSEVARAVAREIRAKMTPEEEERLASARPVDPEAHEAYIRGCHFIRKMSKQADWQVGMEHLRKAVEEDPASALAHSCMAYAYYQGSNLYLDQREAMPAARAAALRALEIDPTLAEAHASLALVEAQYSWNWSGAEQEYRRAIELRPSYAFARQYYALALVARGRTEEAVEEVRQAQELDPLSIDVRMSHALILFLARRYEESIEQSSRVIDLEPDAPAGHAFLGMAYEQSGRFADAIAAFKRSTEVGEITENIAWLAHAHAIAGDRAEAQAELAEIESLSGDRFVSSYSLAIVHAGLGAVDQAFASLARACEERAEWLVMLKVDPRLDVLRKDPRFADIERCVGVSD